MKIPWLKSKSLKMMNLHLYKTQPAAGKNQISLVKLWRGTNRSRWLTTTSFQNVKVRCLFFKSPGFLLCLLLEWTESAFDFPPYFFPLFFCRKVKVSEVCKNCSTKPLTKQQNNFWNFFEWERRSSNSSLVTGSGWWGT